MPITPCINRLATALPPHEAHAGFLRLANERLSDPRERALFRRMAARSGIERRWTVLAPGEGGDQASPGGFYDGDAAPSTAARMAAYATHAPDLCVEAARGLGDLSGVTHVVLASCTGFVAPGIDQIVAHRLGLGSRVERALIGFMGCYAAVAALRTAYHIVRSRPEARVLVITVELCSLHLQPESTLAPILAQMLFGDGAAAALVSGQQTGLALSDPFASTIPDSQDLITWTIGDHGFAMHLAGSVPGRIGEALTTTDLRETIGEVGAIDTWAVHAGGRSVLDAVEQGLDLPADALALSREVLRTCGNMSSATLMFVLAGIVAGGQPVASGLAIAFGPGLAAEGFRFRSAA